MHSCVFWCEFIDLVSFFGLLLFDPCHFSSQNTKWQGPNNNSQKNQTKSMNSQQKTQEYIKGKSPLFIL